MTRFLVALFLVACCDSVHAVTRIEVHALMKDAAILRIDSEQRMLRTGERSPEGVLLVVADPRHAIVEVEGQRRELNLSQRIAAAFEETGGTEVKIPRNNSRQYITSGEINGRRTLVLVDTGATSVALSSTQADALGINYRKGDPMYVSTAGGVKPAYNITLDRVSIGGITVNYVQAGVIEGDFPEHVLLGITYLQHVRMREEDGIMYLRSR